MKPILLDIFSSAEAEGNKETNFYSDSLQLTSTNWRSLAKANSALHFIPSAKADGNEEDSNKEIDLFIAVGFSQRSEKINGMGFSPILMCPVESHFIPQNRLKNSSKNKLPLSPLNDIYEEFPIGDLVSVAISDFSHFTEAAEK